MHRLAAAWPGASREPPAAPPGRSGRARAARRHRAGLAAPAALAALGHGPAWRAAPRAQEHRDGADVAGAVAAVLVLARRGDVRAAGRWLRHWLLGLSPGPTPQPARTGPPRPCTYT